MQQYEDVKYDIPEEVVISASSVCGIIDGTCKRNPATPNGLEAREFTAVYRELLAFLIHFVDFIFLHSLGASIRSQRMEEIAGKLNWILSNVELWEDTKFQPVETLSGIQVTRGFDHEFVNKRLKQYGSLTTPEGDYTKTFEALSDHIAKFIPEKEREDVRTVTTHCMSERLEVLYALIEKVIA